MTKDDHHFRLRLPIDLKDFVQERARQNQRSMNGEIIYALRQAQKTASEHRA